MPNIRFQVLGDSDGTPGPDLDTLSGSGLAFFGASAGSSVQIGAYQQTTYVSNGDASQFTDASTNVQYLADTYPSGRCNLSSVPGTAYETGLSGVRTMYGSLGIEFGHNTAVNVQNCQLRIYDRNNINYPASGVNTKVAEIVNWNGSTYTYDNQGPDDGLTSAAVGSGDLFWWGEPWPADEVAAGKNKYVNSLGVEFVNGLSSDSRVNGDVRLSDAGIALSYDTVGGTGIVVPLLNSPGSGQKQLGATEVVSGSGMVWPKWTQYLTSSTKQDGIFGVGVHSFGDGSDTTKVAGVANIDKTYGGTGVDTHHTWSVAISASPLSSGSKQSYGLYVSLEYY
jgi:hypothetical protein